MVCGLLLAFGLIFAIGGIGGKAKLETDAFTLVGGLGGVLIVLGVLLPC